MKKFYEIPELNTVYFSNEDIVTASGPIEPQTPLIEAASNSIDDADGGLRIKGRNNETIGIIVF